MLPDRTKKAMIHLIEQLAAKGELNIDELLAMQGRFRESAGKLLNVGADEISFIRNTSEGLSIALHSIDWQAGDNMIVQEDAFPASLYLAHYCFPEVEKRYIPLGDGSQFYDRLERMIDARTRAVVIDYVHFLSGYRCDLVKLGEITRATNAYLIVDGIQGLGVVAINLEETPVDFFTAGGVKWMLSPSGTGIFYVRKEILNKLVPFHIGWASAEYEDISSLYPVRSLYQDARRFQPINENYVGMIGLTESISMFNEMGPKVIEQRVLQLTRQIRDVLEEMGFQILTPAEDQLRAGIVTFKHPSIATTALLDFLTQNKVACSLREGWLRFSIHFYNHEDEIEKVSNLLKLRVKSDI